MKLLRWIKGWFAYGKIKRVPTCEDLGHDVQWGKDAAEGFTCVVSYCKTCGKINSSFIPFRL